MRLQIESIAESEAVEHARTKTQDQDKDKTHTLSLIYGGTKVLQTTAAAVTASSKTRGKMPKVPPAPDGGCPAFVLRTAFHSAQGELVRKILFSSEARATASNSREAVLFIAGLLAFAVASVAFLLHEATREDGPGIGEFLRHPALLLTSPPTPPNLVRLFMPFLSSCARLPADRSPFTTEHFGGWWKLALHCVMIVTSVIPPELPLQLTIAVQASIVTLQRLGVYCTEPFRIPFAGRVDVCCFDKTGTLTADRFVVEGIAAYPRATATQGDDGEREVPEANKRMKLISSDSKLLPTGALLAVVGCQGLMRLRMRGRGGRGRGGKHGLSSIEGDPMEQAAMRASHSTNK